MLNTPFYIGQRAMRSHDYEIAIEQFTLYIDHNPSDFQSLIFRGQARFKVAMDEDDIYDAIEDFSNAINAKSDCYLGYYERGLAYLKLNTYSLAIKDFTIVIELKPKLNYAHFYRGISYFKNKQFAESLIDMNSYIDECVYKSFVIDGHKYRADIFYKLKKYANAIQDYSMILQYPPLRESSTYYQRGRAYFNLGNYDEAINDFNLALERDPKNQEASSYQSLVEDIRNLNNINGERTLGDFIQSLLELLEDDDFDKITIETNELIRIYPNFYLGYVFRALVNEDKNDYESAKKDIAFSLVLKPDNKISRFLFNTSYTAPRL